VLIAVAVVAVLAVLVAVLVNTLGDGTDDPGGRGDVAASGEPEPGDGKSGSSKGSSGEPDDRTSPSASDDDGAADDKGGDKDDEGGKGGDKGSGTSDDGLLETTTYTSPQGFTIGLPAGWRYRSSDKAGARFTGPGDQRLLVGWTSTPKDDPVADWEQQEKYMARDQYRRIRIEAVDFRGWNAADWEFTYAQGGTKYRVIDRGFVVSPIQGYALMYTAPSADWDGDRRKDTWDTLTATFRPKS
jgi:hypothetical protein